MSNKPISIAEITDLTKGLNRLARNLWWTWNQEAQDVFQELSPRCWMNLYHNAVAVLREVSDQELRSRLQDPDLARRVREVLQRFDAYLSEKNTWGHASAPELHGRPVAYFSAEFGFHETLPIAAGGLGVLAADHAKSASDLGLGFVGISLFYREGYFQQAINHENWQTEYYTHLNPKNLPLEPVTGPNGEQLVCSVEVASSQVYFHAWRANIGRVPVYLLDTNRPENEEHYRNLTLRVYGGDRETRIMQELVLGVGGVRLLRALGIQPSTFHMNEGHAAFLTLELIREKMAAGKNYDQAFDESRQECIFTTHTPVEAGHDRFSNDIVEYTAHRHAHHLKLTHQQFMGLGRVDPQDQHEPFCMTVLALKCSRAANGVSELHGSVSRQMWHRMYPDLPLEKVPIGHITNGIHLLSWMKGTVRRFWRRKFSAVEPHQNESAGPEAAEIRIKRSEIAWETGLNTPEFWQKMADPNFISDEEIWALRYKLRRELIEFARRRLLIQGQRLTHGDFIAFDQLLNADTLTIGFARRFATYKRAPLVFSDLEKILRLVNDKQRPVQFVFAGKAHPKDDSGKRYIQHVIHLSKFELKGHLVFLENYDVHVARQMVAGCDIWLNNPRRPLEASGTSGMKAGCHGCLNFSILDGWWREGYDGTNGFAIGEDSHPDVVEEQDRLDNENLYKVLTGEIIPCFYNRDAQGIPRQWIQKIRRAMVTLVPQFDTWRMVQEYANKYYVTK